MEYIGVRVSVELKDKIDELSFALSTPKHRVTLRQVVERLLENGLKWEEQEIKKKEVKN
jgi:predicted transcriptional regulator